MKLIDMVGRQFGRLYVMKRSERKTDYNGETLWDCLCECGRTGMYRGRDLRRGGAGIKTSQGYVTSCGCLRSERTAERNKKRAERNRERKYQHESEILK